MSVPTTSSRVAWLRFAEETGFFERDWTASVNFVFGQIGNFCVGYLILPKNQRLTHQLGGVCLNFFLGPQNSLLSVVSIIDA